MKIKKHIKAISTVNWRKAHKVSRIENTNQLQSLTSIQKRFKIRRKARHRYKQMKKKKDSAEKLVGILMSKDARNVAQIHDQTKEIDELEAENDEMRGDLGRMMELVQSTWSRFGAALPENGFTAYMEKKYEIPLRNWNSDPMVTQDLEHLNIPMPGYIEVEAEELIEPEQIVLDYENDSPMEEEDDELIIIEDTENEPELAPMAEQEVQEQLAEMAPRFLVLIQSIQNEQEPESGANGTLEDLEKAMVKIINDKEPSESPDRSPEVLMEQQEDENPNESSKEPEHSLSLLIEQEHNYNAQKNVNDEQHNNEQLEPQPEALEIEQVEETVIDWGELNYRFGRAKFLQLEPEESELIPNDAHLQEEIINVDQAEKEPEPAEQLSEHIAREELAEHNPELQVVDEQNLDVEQNLETNQEQSQLRNDNYEELELNPDPEPEEATQIGAVSEPEPEPEPEHQTIPIVQDAMLQTVSEPNNVTDLIEHKLQALEEPEVEPNQDTQLVEEPEPTAEQILEKDQDEELVTAPDAQTEPEERMIAAITLIAQPAEPEPVPESMEDDIEQELESVLEPQTTPELQDAMLQVNELIEQEKDQDQDPEPTRDADPEPEPTIPALQTYQELHTVSQKPDAMETAPEPTPEPTPVLQIPNEPESDPDSDPDSDPESEESNEVDQVQEVAEPEPEAMDSPLMSKIVSMLMPHMTLMVQNGVRHIINALQLNRQIADDPESDSEPEPEATDALIEPELEPEPEATDALVEPEMEPEPQESPILQPDQEQFEPDHDEDLEPEAAQVESQEDQLDHIIDDIDMVEEPEPVPAPEVHAPIRQDNEPDVEPIQEQHQPNHDDDLEQEAAHVEIQEDQLDQLAPIMDALDIADEPELEPIQEVHAPIAQDNEPEPEPETELQTPPALLHQDEQDEEPAQDAQEEQDDDAQIAPLDDEPEQVPELRILLLQFAQAPDPIQLEDEPIAHNNEEEPEPESEPEAVAPIQQPAPVLELAPTQLRQLSPTPQPAPMVQLAPIQPPAPVLQNPAVQHAPAPAQAPPPKKRATKRSHPGTKKKKNKRQKIFEIVEEHNAEPRAPNRTTERAARFSRAARDSVKSYRAPRLAELDPTSEDRSKKRRYKNFVLRVQKGIQKVPRTRRRGRPNAVILNENGLEDEAP